MLSIDEVIWLFGMWCWLM